MPRKIIVAVHGIGEQMRGETIRSVANQVCRFHGVPASMPLGRFGAELIPAPGGPASGTVVMTNPSVYTLTLPTAPAGPASGTLVIAPASPGQGVWSANTETIPPGSFLVETPPDPSLKAALKKRGLPEDDIVFGEVYWADIPRGPVAHRYTLEGAKEWATAVVERVRSRDLEAGQFYDERSHYEFARVVIGQMVEGIGVLGRIAFLAEKAGLVKFDLDDLLVSYLGDVQVVTEFQNYRRQILDSFHALMNGLHNSYPDDPIFVIGHSEGSVVAFLAILEALHGQTSGFGDTAGQPLLRGKVRQPAPWAGSLRGLMTIGSPIGKHLLLWPWLWHHLEKPAARPATTIPWCNYYDRGDPVGFDVTQAGNWLTSYGWGKSFAVTDTGFTRYWLPGKAHTDYWTDAGVFDHFLGNVVWPNTLPALPPSPNPLPARPTNEGPPVPGTYWIKAWAVSWCAPYLLALLVMLLAVYLLLKGVTEVHGIEESTGDLILDTLGLGALLAGGTTLARVPRLTWRRKKSAPASAAPDPTTQAPVQGWTWSFRWVAFSLVLFVLGNLGFLYLVSDGLHERLWLLLSAVGVDRLPVVLGIAPTSWMVLVLALIVVVIVYWLSRRWPKLGVKPIVFIGTLVIFALVGLAWVPSSPFSKYFTIKEVTAEQTGLRGPALDRTTSVVMRGLSDRNRLSDSDLNELKEGRSKEGQLRIEGRREIETLLDQFSKVQGVHEIKREARESEEEFQKKKREVHEKKGKALEGIADKNRRKLLQDEKVWDKLKPPQPASLEGGVLIVPQECCAANDLPKARAWPLVLAGAAFLYLWWLAALVLDLTVVWHYFIKGEAILRRLQHTEETPH